MRVNLGGLGVFPLAFGLAFALTGCAEPTVVRVIDGHEVEGRFISDHAYALYARAAQEEARGGDKGLALAALEAAQRDDPGSVEIWTRIGALHCRAPSSDVAKGEEALERARSLDPEYAPLYRERARCALAAADREASQDGKRRQLTAALAAAERSLGIDPDDLATARLAADILSRLGRDSDARWQLVSFTIRRPSSVEGLRALHQFGRAHGDEPLARRAAARLRALGAAAPEETAALPLLAEIDDALVHDDLPAAQRLAHRARLPLGELAVRAAALGRIATARKQAEIIVGADPSDTSARIALAVAADLARDDVALACALEGSPTSTSVTSAATATSVRTPTATSVRTPTATSVRTPIATSVRTPTATSVRTPSPASSPTATSVGSTSVGSSTWVGPPPSPLARLLFAEVLARHISPEAARSYLGPDLLTPADRADDLRARVEARVRAKLTPVPPTAAPTAR